MHVLGVVPARFASTRLPGKPLADIGGRPMIQHVWERAGRARTVDALVVATDDDRVAAAVTAFGGAVVLTAATHLSGTDRIAEVAGLRPEATVLVNVQGDEPLLDPGCIDAAVEALGDAEMATVACPLRDAAAFLGTAVVKVVVDQRGQALYFSRAPIPHLRGAAPEAAVERGLARRHLGIYAYRREALLALAAAPPSPLELAESLEQLRALHLGLRIRVADWDGTPGPAVDTPDDLERVRTLLAHAR